jgi:hypothetical protein
LTIFSLLSRASQLPVELVLNGKKLLLMEVQLLFAAANLLLSRGNPSLL